jgi:hypothetical protein
MNMGWAWALQAGRWALQADARPEFVFLMFLRAPIYFLFTCL